MIERYLGQVHSWWSVGHIVPFISMKLEAYPKINWKCEWYKPIFLYDNQINQSPNKSLIRRGIFNSLVIFLTKSMSSNISSVYFLCKIAISLLDWDISMPKKYFNLPRSLSLNCYLRWALIPSISWRLLSYQDLWGDELCYLQLSKLDFTTWILQSMLGVVSLLPPPLPLIFLTRVMPCSWLSSPRTMMILWMDPSQNH